MSEQPQTAREGEQGDLLEQIIARGLEKIDSPAQAEATEESQPEKAPSAPEPAGGEAGASPAARKAGRYTVYLYLLVLFGAAFLMLLLAYLIQQRASEAAMNELRESLDLSREEMQTEINALEAQNAALREELDRLADLPQQLYGAQESLYSWASFWMLEQFYQLKNYEACAAVLLMQQQGQYTYLTPDSARQAEIIRAVVNAGILDMEYAQHPEDYQSLLTAYSQP